MNSRKRLRKTGSASLNPTASTAKLACTLCRQRKIRCNAERPACGYCLSKARQFAYPDAFKRAHCSQRYVHVMLTSLTCSRLLYLTKRHSYVDSLEKRVKQLEATWTHDANQLLLGDNEMSNSSNGGGVLKGTPTTASGAISLSRSRTRRETLGRYGKSSTEHFALTLEASTDGAKTAPDELHHERHLSASSDCSSAAGVQDVFCRSGNLEKRRGW